MGQTIQQEKDMVYKKRQSLNFKKKAVFLDKFLSFLEDNCLGYLMRQTEDEENISLEKAKLCKF